MQQMAEKSSPQVLQALSHEYERPENRKFLYPWIIFEEPPSLGCVNKSFKIGFYLPKEMWKKIFSYLTDKDLIPLYGNCLGYAIMRAFDEARGEKVGLYRRNCVSLLCDDKGHERNRFGSV